MKKRPAIGTFIRFSWAADGINRCGQVTHHYDGNSFGVSGGANGGGWYVSMGDRFQQEPVALADQEALWLEIDRLQREVASTRSEGAFEAIGRTAVLGAATGGMLGQLYAPWAGWLGFAAGAFFGGWIGSRSR